MTNLKEMPLDTTLQKGDIVTITGPGEHDVLVREVTGVQFSGAAKMHGMFYGDIPFSESLASKGRTLTRIQRPVPALPTVEGDYILTMPNSYRLLVSLRDGVWLNASGDKDDAHWLTARVEDGSTLTRVIPADGAKHPEVDVEAATSGVDIAAAREAFAATHSHSNDDPDDDFEAVLTRVLKGEFNK